MIVSVLYVHFLFTRAFFLFSFHDGVYRSMVLSSSAFVFMVDMLIASSKTLKGIMYLLMITFRITHPTPPNMTAKTTAPATLNPITRSLLMRGEGEKKIFAFVAFADVLFVIAGDVDLIDVSAVVTVARLVGDE